MIRLERLTPPGNGAIAVLRLSGPGAWDALRSHVSLPNSKAWPSEPPLHRVWYGRCGGEHGDEVVVAVKRIEPDFEFEIQSHGGQRVVAWIAERFGVPLESPSLDRIDALLIRAPTFRTAAILLEQRDGRRERAMASNDPAVLARLVQLESVGRHLVEPWKVVLAGPPNSGKSSLLNALAGFQRSIVSPIAGTTRDAVTATLAFDGWPVALTDTAGLREAGDGIEAQGIARAERAMSEADLILWLSDSTDPAAPLPPECHSAKVLPVASKADLAGSSRGLAVSATTGAGLPELIAAIVGRLVPHPPRPGEAVPVSA